MSDVLRRLRYGANSALRMNYAPHTDKRIIAAVLTASGAAFGGSNIEGRSRTTKHAEEVAIIAAIAGGQDPHEPGWLRAIYINGASPCGACRQFMLEFGDANTLVYVEYGIDPCYRTTLGSLLPEPYGEPVA